MEGHLLQNYIYRRLPPLSAPRMVEFSEEDSRRVVASGLGEKRMRVSVQWAGSFWFARLKTFWRRNATQQHACIYTGLQA